MKTYQSAEMIVRSFLVVVLTATTAYATEKGAKPCGVEEARLRVASDAQALRQFSEYVTFKNGYYEFRLRNGKTRKLPIAIDDENTKARLLLVDYLRTSGLFLLTRLYSNSEGTDAITLVDDGYGVRHEVNGIPLFHEGCDRFIAIDVCDFGCRYEVSVWDRARGNGTWGRVWLFAPYDYWISSTVKWLSDKEVLVTKEVYRTPDNPSSGTVKRALRIVLTNEGWVMRDSTSENKR